MLRSVGESEVLSIGEGERGQGGRPVDYCGLGEGPAGGLKPIVEGGGLHCGPGVSRLGSEDCRLCPGSGVSGSYCLDWGLGVCCPI